MAKATYRWKLSTSISGSPGTRASSGPEFPQLAVVSDVLNVDVPGPLDRLTDTKLPELCRYPFDINFLSETSLFGSKAPSEPTRMETTLATNP
ncbi:hypothetical protein HNY73_007483 [Argiope bruennichi]|uniref:Uncharacterized protein n=1 Tax=Argiope bruennichi TaxID=94029 RepID=A0A8T0FGN4_ARGBR|nr:hypothetical protein HNY73_007483 [Argiope bruennichi]